MVQGVLFDLFETLVTESVATMRRASSLAAALRVDEQAYRQRWRAGRLDVVLGRRSFRDQLAQIVHGLGGAPDEGLLDHLRLERLEQKAAVLRSVEPDVLDAIGTLRAKGLKLALVTNAFAEDIAGWDCSPLRSLFDVTVFSCATGLAKPDPRIYQLACRELDVRPSHALFIGDGADEELSGARSAGLPASRALWFLTRWPHVTLPSDEPGLRHPMDIVQAAMVA